MTGRDAHVHTLKVDQPQQSHLPLVDGVHPEEKVKGSVAGVPDNPPGLAVRGGRREPHRFQRLGRFSGLGRGQGAVETAVEEQALEGKPAGRPGSMCQDAFDQAFFFRRHSEGEHRRNELPARGPDPAREPAFPEGAAVPAGSQPEIRELQADRLHQKTEIEQAVVRRIHGPDHETGGVADDAVRAETLEAFRVAGIGGHGQETDRRSERRLR